MIMAVAHPSAYSEGPYPPRLTFGASIRVTAGSLVVFGHGRIRFVGGGRGRGLDLHAEQTATRCRFCIQARNTALDLSRGLPGSYGASRAVPVSSYRRRQSVVAWAASLLPALHNARAEILWEQPHVAVDQVLASARG
jgi:hypothetical protein